MKALKLYLQTQSNGDVLVRCNDGTLDWYILRIISESGRIALIGGIHPGVGFKLDSCQAVMVNEQFPILKLS